MAGIFVQLIGISGTVDYQGDRDSAALARDFCEEVNKIIAQNKYAPLQLVGWTLEDNMKRWVKAHDEATSPTH